MSFKENLKNWAVWDRMTKRQLLAAGRNSDHVCEFDRGYKLNYTYPLLGGTHYGNSTYYFAHNTTIDIWSLFSSKYVLRRDDDSDSELVHMVNDWEIIHSLTPKTHQTFKDLIDEL
jgi:hypothetical protein